MVRTHSSYSIQIPLIQQAITALGRNRIIGVVLNRADDRHATGSNGYYASHYYGSYSDKKE